MKIKEKKVELIELFYDLIYVYAISRLTAMIEKPSGGIIPLPDFFRCEKETTSSAGGKKKLKL